MAFRLILLAFPVIAAAQGPSVVTILGRQLNVAKRLPDGGLTAPALYIIRGVNWSPASLTTTDSPQSRRPEFAKWAPTDIPLMKAMNVNTVRMYIDPGLDASALAVMDQLYAAGIMVVLTVDDGLNDTTRLRDVVNFYRNHPAVLMWLLGNEWNYNRYYGKFSNVDDAARETQIAANLVKSLDGNRHPVATNFGDPNNPSLAAYVGTVCTSVDVWSFNVYRGNTFGDLFTAWRNLTGNTPKPMFIGEFGTDAFHNNAGKPDEMMQSGWTLSLWNHLAVNLISRNATNVASGGFAFEWNDEPWKAPSSKPLFGGHPDNFANENYFGIVTVDRKPRRLHDTLRKAFHPAYEPTTIGTVYGATSSGGDASSDARLYLGGNLIFDTAHEGRGPGFVVTAINPITLEAMFAPRRFDTYNDDAAGTQIKAFTAFLNSIPNGAMLLLAVSDEAGLTLAPPLACTVKTQPWIEAAYQAIEAFGAKKIRSYCYRNSYALAAVKGEGRARAEQLGAPAEVSVETILPEDPAVPPAALRFVPMTPCRLMETRAAYNFEGRTGAFGPPFLNAAETRTLNLAQSPVCPIPAAAKALVLNVTLVPRGAVDFVTVWPGGDARPTYWTVSSPDGQIVANSAIVSVANSALQVYASHATDLLLDVSGYFTDDPQLSNQVFYPMTPCRVIETRLDYRTPPGPYGPPSLNGQESRRFRFPNTPYCSIPQGATAYSVTITAVPQGALQFLTAWPAGSPQPNVSNINSPAGRVLANSVILPAGPDGSIDVYAFNRTDMIIDINGYFAPDNGVGLFYYPVKQCRASDSRTAIGPLGGPIFAAGVARTLPIGESACDGVPSTARAFALNVTALPGGAQMPFLTAWQPGESQPNASILNAFEGQTVTNSAIIPAAGYAVSILAFRQTHVVVELSGYFSR